MHNFRYWFIHGSIVIGLIFTAVFVGTADVDIGATLDGLFNKDDSVISTILWKIRLPRLFVSFVAGGCLGLAGILIQTSTRSPLADPNLFGVGGGSIIVLALSIAGFINLTGYWLLFGSIAGALVISSALFALTTTKTLTPTRLILMGIALGSLTLGIGISVVSHGKVFPTQVIGLVAGSFTSSTWEVLWGALFVLIICFGFGVLIAGKLNPLLLGDSIARSLGIKPWRVRIVIFSLVAVLTGASVYAGGLISFVGLLSPHLARRLYGNNVKGLLVSSTLIGATITLMSDQFASLILSPSEMPIGLATTILGAPVMMLLAFKIR